jgi:F-type H+-transporting ATPase subunit b
MVSIDINISLLWQMANFLVIMLLLNYILYKPIRGMLRQRADKVAQMGGEITAKEEGAKKRQEELEDQLAEARRQGVAATDEMKAEGRAKEREIVEAATQEMEDSVAKVRREIQSQIGQAREELKDQVQSFGKELAQKILGRSIQ